MSYGEMEQQYTVALQKLIELQKKYGLDSTETLKAQKKLAEFQVVTPLFGFQGPDFCFQFLNFCF